MSPRNHNGPPDSLLSTSFQRFSNKITKDDKPASNLIVDVGGASLLPLAFQAAIITLKWSV